MATPSANRMHMFIAIAVSLALSLPAILSSYVVDDRLFTSDYYNPGTLGLYDYISEIKRLGLEPWWSAEDLKIRFFRPLSSLLLNLDLTIGNKRPIVPHLHQVIWFAALLIGAYRVLEQILTDRNRITWAFYLFAIAGYHTFLVGFIATRHALMANTFGMWALFHYISFRRRRGKRHHAIAISLFILGLLSGEAAVSFVPMAIAYDLFFTEGSIKTKMRRPLWVLSVLGGYLLFYRLAGFGTKSTAFYMDPLSSPLAYLQNLPAKLLAMVGDFALGIPSTLMLDEDGYLPEYSD